MVRLQIATDVTEMNNLEMRLQQAQKMEAIGSLASGIAHDFNNILFPIVGLSEILMDDLPPESNEHQNVVQIYKAGNRGSDLVQQILAFSRQSEQKKMPIRVQQILKEVMKLSRSIIPADINITQDIQSDCSLVQADATQIHQIAMNLVTNAYHAVESKSGKISVRLREVEIGFGQLPESDLLPGRYAVLSVSDTGIGIEPAIMPKIFEPYFTTKEPGKGTGLGLAVVYGIAREHHGDIKAYSELGKGTTFNVYLPIMTHAERSVSIAGKNKFTTGHERILLVDDDEAIAKLEKQMLERLGYKVTMRLNSLEALEAFKTKPDLFDLVVSDMTMPNITGDRLARELIAIRPDIPIIICTGFSERLDQEKAENIGVKGLLMKPIIKADMAKMVRKVLDETKGTLRQ
jgi:nitrogen-specific signal transduction histidine kinase/ActR/RegA family two-component response regulator